MVYLRYWDFEVRGVVDSHIDIENSNILSNANDDKTDIHVDFYIQVNVRVDCAREINFLNDLVSFY